MNKDTGNQETISFATNFALGPQDVVYVSTAKVSRWNRITGQILLLAQLFW